MKNDIGFEIIEEEYKTYLLKDAYLATDKEFIKSPLLYLLAFPH